MGVPLFWIASIGFLVASVTLLADRRRLLVAAAVLVLCIPAASQAISGNIDALLLFLSVALWRAGTERHERTVGVVVGVIIAIKLTPLALG